MSVGKRRFEYYFRHKLEDIDGFVRETAEGYAKAKNIPVNQVILPDSVVRIPQKFESRRQLDAYLSKNRSVYAGKSLYAEVVPKEPYFLCTGRLYKCEGCGVRTNKDKAKKMHGSYFCPLCGRKLNEVISKRLNYTGGSYIRLYFTRGAESDSDIQES